MVKLPEQTGGFRRSVQASPEQMRASAGKRSRMWDYITQESWPAQAAKAVWGAATLPGDVYKGKVDPLSNESIERSADLAGSLTLGGATLRRPPQNSLGVFGGKMHMDPDQLQQLSKAERLEKLGGTPEEIHRETGMHRWVDGEWRFEISDEHAFLNPKDYHVEAGLDYGDGQNISRIKDTISPMQIRGQSTGAAISQIIHPKLFYYFPDMELGLVEAHLGRRPWGSTAGSYSPRDQIYKTSGYDEDDLMDTLVHEIQHGVQESAGFAKGTSPQGVKGSPRYELEKYRAYEAAELHPQAGGPLSDMDKHNIEIDVARNLYLRSAGEAESRMVTDRRWMTDQERRENFPRPDIPEENLVVDFDDLSPEEELELAQYMLRYEDFVQPGKNKK